MSYYINIGFCEADKTSDVFDEIERIKDYIVKNYQNIIDDNITYNPVFRRTDVFDDEELLNSMNLNFLNTILSFRVIYWDKLKLMGIVSNFDIEGLKYFCFQNSTDQDYKDSDWPDIAFFKKAITKHETIQDEYKRKTKTTKHIIKRLAIEDYVYNNEKSDKFSSFIVSPGLTADSVLCYKALAYCKKKVNELK